jgi:hypothetical protein
VTTTDWPTGGFDAPFNEAFQPDLGPPDVWTAEIGGNALECYIAKDSLTIRMGKDEPDPMGQAPTGTATFEVIGDPVRPVASPLAWTAGTAWTDAPDAVHDAVRPDGVTWNRMGTGQWPAAEISDRTFRIASAGITIPGSWSDVTRGAWTVNVFAALRENMEGQVYASQAGQVRAYAWNWTGDPASGGVEVGPIQYGNWATPDQATRLASVTLPAATLPSNVRWVQIGFEFNTRTQEPPQIGEGKGRRMVNMEVGGSLSVPFTYGVPDTFEPGEKVIIKRNGLTVWTGWVTDEEREWSPSLGSVSKVNAAGPRAQYQRRFYVKNPVPDLERFPGWMTEARPLAAYAGHLDSASGNLIQYGLDTYAADAGLKLGTVNMYTNSGFHPVMDLLDGAANAALGQVWEKRDGRLAVYGHAYYRGEAPADWYVNDRTVLNCDDIDAPVQVRREATYITSYTADLGFVNRGSPSGQDSAPDPPTGFSKYVPRSDSADREYSVTPQVPMLDATNAQAKWDFMSSVWGRAGLEQVDRWTVARDRVSDELWTRLMTMWLGWPVRITNLPQGLFRDGKTQFDGFLWGWEMRGTEEVTLTLIDQRMFV